MKLPQRFMPVTFRELLKGCAETCAHAGTDAVEASGLVGR